MCNNAIFNDTDNETAFCAIMFYKGMIAAGYRAALAYVISQDDGDDVSVFDSYQWLTYAFLNNHKQQILYAMHQGCYKPADVLDGLNHRAARMPLSVVPELLNMLNKKQIKTLIKNAEAINNKKMLSAIGEYQNKKNMITFMNNFDLKLMCGRN